MKAKRGRPDWYFIEYAMDRGGCFYRDAPSKWIYGYANISPLVKAGYVVLDREVKRDGDTQLFFKPTPEGIRWWIDCRVADCLETQERMCRYPDWKYELDPASLAPAFEGKGMGNPIDIYCPTGYNPAIWFALQRGLVNFVSHRDYSGGPHNFEEYITVKLTRKGFDFYAALPQLVEVF